MPSFIDLLKNARSEPVSVLHQFMTNYDPHQTRRVYAFVEGKPDEAFYRAHIQSYEPNPTNIFVYNCEGKANVYDAYRRVIVRYPNCSRVLFFVDKDVDDIVGTAWPLDPRICVTDCYSIENYLAECTVLSRFFADFVKIRRVAMNLGAMFERFDDDMRAFHSLVLPVMAWVVVMRRTGHQVILADVDMGQFFEITDSGVRRRRGARLSTLARITKTQPFVAKWREIRKTCRELQRLPAKHYIRGKFEAWWFIGVIRKIVDTLVTVVREKGGSVSVSVQLNENSFVQLLARAISSPPVIDTYLRFHLTRDLVIKQRVPTQVKLSFIEKLWRFFRGS